MERTFDEEENSSPPCLPDTSAGSSVSSQMEEEFNEILRQSLIAPNYDPTLGANILQDPFGLFKSKLQDDESTNKETLTAKVEELSSSNIETNQIPSSQNYSSIQTTEIVNKLEQLSPDPDPKAEPELPTIQTKTESIESNEVNIEIKSAQLENDEMKINNDETMNNKQKIVLLSSSSSSSSAESNYENNNNNLNNDKKMNSNHLERITHQSNINNNNNEYHFENDLELSVDDLTTSNTSKFLSNIDLYNYRTKLLREELAKSATLTQVSNEISSFGQQSSSDNHSNNNNNNNNNNRQFEFTSNNESNDANPRRNSPVPASPPSNLDLVLNECSSIEPLTNLPSLVNSKNYFKPIDINNNNQTKVENNEPLTKNVKIATCLDKWYKELKGHVLSEFEKSRIQLMQEQQKKLIEEKERQATEISKLKKELDMVRESLKVCERNTLKKDAAIENLSKAFEKQREKNDLQRVMMEWKIKRLENAKEDFTTKLAEKYYNNRLRIKAFVCWHYFIIQRHKIKLEKACKKKAEEVCLDLATKYETKIKKLEEELSKSKIEIERYKVEMAKNEENIKKALMRGVCALNMEAMSIFNEPNKTPTIPMNSNFSYSIDQNQDQQQQHQQQQNMCYSTDQHQKHSKSHVFYCPKSSQMDNHNPILNENQNLNHRSSFQPTNRFDLLNPSSQLLISSSQTDLNSANINREAQDLARKVKIFCDGSLSSSKRSTSSASINPTSINHVSAVTKAKWHLLNGNHQQEQPISSHSSSSQQLNHQIQHQQQLQQQQQQQKYKHTDESNLLTINPNVITHIKSNNRIFDELGEHNLPIQTKNTSRQLVKSKIGSFSSTEPTASLISPHSSTTANKLTKTSTQQTPSNNISTNPYRSIIIEKHTSNNNTNNNNINSSNLSKNNKDLIKSTTTSSKVKYAPLGQPATVLNTVISSVH